ncbi:hypothetical protein CEUSTIGMA_g7921.t1 [Chlamydomonas eustigma]|uniref:PPM-type phosphatase domain-containing protein n=1 Tax=Chlamydomonas eustigma TaxID=1157962 RepID=A0A250XBL4_9CHLO|nr:hypothetical protein CEUSTIGMA_g7921.t1 [Chlamydomonas eustigma]|eukprot:GAX80483.1 hypothetical protein CEUSTIGMA_g7921.t1 [Chlamydomonas eustigma]
MDANCENKRASLKRNSKNFYLQHSTSFRNVKGEDVIFIDKVSDQGMLYMVCDGHLGIDAASYVESNLQSLLTPLLPTCLPKWESRIEVETYAETVRRAICSVFVKIENEWLDCGNTAGTTVTLILVTGCLLTAANVGDSAAVLDTGCSILELTDSHRIQTHVKEKARLDAAGCNIAQLGFHLEGPAKPGTQGVGPLRVWPGGLCVSRSIGDVDAGPEILPLPHIKQVLVPEEGCRVIMSSDGLWDILTLSKAVKMVRPKPNDSAAQTLVNATLRDQRFNDDTSVIVVDILPSLTASFPNIALQAALHPAVLQRQQSAAVQTASGGFCSCFRAEPEEPNAMAESEPDAPGQVTLLCDMDTSVAYPHLLHELVLKSDMVLKQNHVFAHASSDFTVHGDMKQQRQQHMPNGSLMAGVSGLMTPSPSLASGLDTLGSSGGALRHESVRIKQVQSSQSLLTPQSSERDPNEDSTEHSNQETSRGGVLHYNFQLGSGGGQAAGSGTGSVRAGSVYSPSLQVTLEETAPTSAARQQHGASNNVAGGWTRTLPVPADPSEDTAPAKKLPVADERTKKGQSLYASEMGSAKS